MTENAIRTQLQTLERLGLAARVGSKPSATKPAMVFGITPQGQAAFSAAYAPVLRHLVDAAVLTMPKRQLNDLMQQCGKQIAAAFGTPPARLDDRVSSAADILNGLGGDASVRRKGASFRIESTGCPLSAVTADVPAACRIVQAVVRHHVRARVEICCEVEASPQCCFVITPNRGRSPAA